MIEILSRDHPDDAARVTESSVPGGWSSEVPNNLAILELGVSAAWYGLDNPPVMVLATS